jgi:hypothetical protein
MTKRVKHLEEHSVHVRIISKCTLQTQYGKVLSKLVWPRIDNSGVLLCTQYRTIDDRAFD